MRQSSCIVKRKYKLFLATLNKALDISTPGRKQHQIMFNDTYGTIANDVMEITSVPILSRHRLPEYDEILRTGPDCRNAFWIFVWDSRRSLAFALDIRWRTVAKVVTTEHSEMILQKRISNFIKSKKQNNGSIYVHKYNQESSWKQADDATARNHERQVKPHISMRLEANLHKNEKKSTPNCIYAWFMVWSYFSSHSWGKWDRRDRPLIQPTTFHRYTAEEVSRSAGDMEVTNEVVLRISTSRK